MQEPRVLGIHHITAIAGAPQRNLDFYTAFLGLRLVKKTVNFDDPGTYHFYFGDAMGRPGSILTFFPWPGARPGRHGNGQVTLSSFAAPSGSLGFWLDRAQRFGVAATAGRNAFGEERIRFADPDGLGLEIVAAGAATAQIAEWQSPVPADSALAGFHSATVSQEGYERTAQLLTEVLGFRLEREAGAVFRYRALEGGAVDLVCAPDGPHGLPGAGTVHHIAWRAADDAQQLTWRNRLVQLNYNVSPVLDRQYFHSIYFREPGGVLFEIATDPPGFTADEALSALGSTLRLPPSLEPMRKQIEASLEPVTVAAGDPPEAA